MSCWLLDGRICFSPSTVESVGNDLTIELSPILRSPGRPAPKTPVTRMMLSVAWLMRIAGMNGGHNCEVLQTTLSVWRNADAPALIESVQEAHRRVAFTYGSYDPVMHYLSLLRVWFTSDLGCLGCCILSPTYCVSRVSVFAEPDCRH